MKTLSAGLLQVLLLTSLALLFTPARNASGEEKPVIPSVDGGLGRCVANFTVTDSNKKPIYNAKIDVVLRYGLGGLHKSALQVGTNSDGKARVIGLPERSKKSLEFRITSGELSKTILLDPSLKCDAAFDVSLEPK